MDGVLTGEAQSLIWSGFLPPSFATYGRSPKKPTVGCLDDPR
ncbi:hypothetical protein HMPREF1556_00455 [Porphyromonas sp. oral taxon 278 str. W7784]|nr:hypothetical protein HMPREF1556_00455 [Porphyromonas sp. oral taxon 278 str. W7784]